MKLFLKKINRGFILTFAFVLAIAGYYRVEAIRIAPEKAAIIEAGKEFGKIYRNGKIRKSGYRDFVEYPADVLNSHRESVQKQLEKLYIKDAPGAGLWVSDFFDDSSIDNPYEYYSKFTVTFKKAHSFKLIGEEASVVFVFTVKSTLMQKTSTDDSEIMIEDKHSLIINMNLKKSGGQWKAVETSAMMSWGGYY